MMRRTQHAVLVDVPAISPITATWRRTCLPSPRAQPTTAHPASAHPVPSLDRFQFQRLRISASPTDRPPDLSMPRGRAEPTRAQISHGLEYVANKPAFLQNFGAPAASSASPGARGTGRGGREPLPERPGDGEWAKGSDDDDDESEEEDEWDQRFGGGDDGPQVVVLKEGRHLTAAEVERERMIGGF